MPPGLRENAVNPDPTPTHILVSSNGYVWLLANIRPSTYGASVFSADAKCVKVGEHSRVTHRAIDPGQWRSDIVFTGNERYLAALDELDRPLRIRTVCTPSLTVEPV